MARALLHAQISTWPSGLASGIRIAPPRHMVTWPVRTVATMAAVGFILGGCSRDHKDPTVLLNEQHAAAIEQIVSSPPAWVERGRIATTLWEAEQRFYRSRGNAPAWIDGDLATARFNELAGILRQSDEHGLDPARYATAQFEQAIQAARANKGHVDPGQVARLDTRLTYAYLQYAADLLGW